ncbi:carbohydrate ABC transporter permease [Tengunoibacter tsumagoiensis]|uniref:ABC transporter permease n=1 Tax=Tengunoibacter tsumagoiensis TaxID=2014871 RepID=A0A402A1D1_9CHLR|nr:sugar ABC transporter permease [Tengunoibacter tsumagoiensis]GCE12821.1 ABC transporter permease [Tengunoibacter tsumagoiensis]
MAMQAKTTPVASAAQQDKRDRQQKLKITLRAYLWLAPIIICMAVIVFYPLVNGLILSFTNADQTNIAQQIGAMSYPATYHFIGLQNYTTIISGWFQPGSDESHVIFQTIIWVVANCFFHFIFAMGLALILNRPMRGRTIYRTLLMVPWAMPQFVAAFAWRFLYNQQGGYINKLLDIFHLPAIAWGSDPTWALISVIIVNIWLGIPFMTVTLLGGLQSIPAEMYEAAAMDGASAWQRFRSITLPMLRPIAFLSTMLDVIWTFNVFAVIYLITQGGPFNRSQTLFTYAWTKAFQVPQHYGLGGAYGIIILVILLVFTIIYSRMLRSNETVY